MLVSYDFFMKKNKMFVLLLVFCFAVDLSFCSFKKNINTNEPLASEINRVAFPYYSPRNTSLGSFFSKLKTNYPYNYKGSCVYIAICNYLSYFDSVYSDNLIPETMDRSSNGTSTSFLDNGSGSPGVDQDPMLAEGGSVIAQNQGMTFTDEAYWETEMSRTDTSLHAALLSIGYNLGFVSLPDGMSNAKDMFGLFPNQTVSLITQYLSSFLSIPASEYSFVGVNYDPCQDGYICQYNAQITAFCQQQIDSGYPVLLFARSIEGTAAHCLIVYDYVTEGGVVRLLCHDGRKSVSRPFCRTPEDGGFSDYNAAFSVHFSLSNVQRPNNFGYVLNDGTQQYHGPEMFSPISSISLFSNSIFVLPDECVPLDSSFHHIVCHCGLSYGKEPHHWRLYNQGNISQLICLDCGYIKLKATLGFPSSSCT